MNFNYPSKSDISPTLGLNLDERDALSHFFGKNKRDAKLLFEENCSYYTQDLMWMGAVAFNYYLESLYDWLSSQSKLDVGSISLIISMLNFRIHSGESELENIRRLNFISCLFDVLNRFIDSYADDDMLFYPNLKDDFHALQYALSKNK